MIIRGGAGIFPRDGKFFSLQVLDKLFFSWALLNKKFFSAGLRNKIFFSDIINCTKSRIDDTNIQNMSFVGKSEGRAKLHIIDRHYSGII